MLFKTIAPKKDISYLMNKHPGVISKVESEILLEYLFNCSRTGLYIRDFGVNRTVEELYDSLVSRRLSGEPVQYITGHAEFMGLDFIVTLDTLIPRPETEILVSEVLALCLTPNHSQGKILDLCAGSGNIAVSLAKAEPLLEIIATDISESALRIAQKNAVRHSVSDRIKFLQGNLFGALMFAKNPKFDIIVCNPPYIKELKLPYLQKEVSFEPRIALNGGRDGLDFYRVIAKESPGYLKKGGSILLEIGFGQAQAVKDIFSSYNIFEIQRIVEDFNSIQRVIWINLL